MKLHLKDFLCYEDQTITLSQGIALIRGESGAGKTTIFEAIAYALYGKIRSPYRDGTKKCMVKLNLIGVCTITRRSGPGYLSLETEKSKYEGREAQAIINDLFGDHTDFMSTTYIQQDERCPLLSGTNADKLEAIRTIGFKKQDVGQKQELIKVALKTAQAVSAETSNAFASAEAALTRFNNLNPDVKNIQADAEDVSVDDMNAEVKQLETEVKGLRVTRDTRLQNEATLKALKDVEVTDVDVDDAEAKRDAFKESLQQIIALQTDAMAKKAAINAQSQLSGVRDSKQKAVDELKAKMDELVKDIDLDSIDATMKRIQTNFDCKAKGAAICKSVDLESHLDFSAESQAESDKLGDLTNKMNMIQNSMDIIRQNEEQKKKLQCPKCSAGLALQDGSLVLIDDTFTPTAKEVPFPAASESELNKVRADMAKCTNRIEAIRKAMQDYRKAMVPLGKIRPSDEARLEQMKQYKASLPRLEELQKDLADMSTDADSDAPVSTESIDEELKKLADQIKTQRDEIHNLESVLKDKARFVEHRAKIVAAEKALVGLSASDLNVQIEEKTKRIAELKKIINSYKKLFEYEELQTEYDVAKERFDETAGKAQNLSALLDISKQVERTILQDTVACFNLELKKFLDVMFQDDPMTVEFNTTKDLKKKGAKSMTCSLKIFYKDIEFQNYKRLSGGEKDRLSLAMLLTMNVLLGSDLILLDESLKALHQDLKLRLVEYLRSTFGKSKICVVIGHEENTGPFAPVVTVTRSGGSSKITVTRD